MVHESINALKKVLKKSIDEFCFNRCFRESSLRNYKKSSALRFTRFYVFRNRVGLLAFSGL